MANQKDEPRETQTEEITIYIEKVPAIYITSVVLLPPEHEDFAAATAILSGIIGAVEKLAEGEADPEVN